MICTKILFKGFADSANINAKLETAYKYFNDGKMFDDAHDAFADIKACHNVFVNCCKTLNMWPRPDGCLAVMMYSNGYHKQIPTNIWQASLWNNIAQIELCEFGLQPDDAFNVCKLSVKATDNIYHLDCLHYYGIDEHECQHGFTLKTALHLLNVYVQFNRLVVFYDARLHFGLLNAQYVRCKANAGSNYNASIVNAVLQKPYLYDLNLALRKAYPGLQCRPDYIKRKDAWLKLFDTETLPDCRDAEIIARLFKQFANVCTPQQFINGCIDCAMI